MELSSHSWRGFLLAAMAFNPCGASWGAAQQGTAVLGAPGTLWKQFPSTGGQEHKEGKRCDGSDLVRSVKDEGQPWLERAELRVLRERKGEKAGSETWDQESRSSLLRGLLGRVHRMQSWEKRGPGATIDCQGSAPPLLPDRQGMQQGQQGIEQGIQGLCVNTNPGVQGWGQDSQSAPRAGSGREQERQQGRQQGRVLQLHPWL